MEKQQNKMTVKVSYVKAPEYISIYACGCHGGITPNGDLQMNFYEDRIQIPEAANIEIKNGKASEPTVRQAEFDRTVKCSVTYKGDNIPALIKWLETRYVEFKNSRIIESANEETVK